MKTRPCRKCNGSGREVDPVALGFAMRQKRTAAGVGLREMARRLDITAPYLSDMEYGKRMFQPGYQAEYAKLGKKGGGK